MRSGVIRVAALAVLLLAGVPASAWAATITASGPPEINFGKPAIVKGDLTGHVVDSGVQVELQVTPFPYTAAFKTIATKTTDASGRFSFSTRPDFNSRYRVIATDGTATSNTVKVFVNGLDTTKVRRKGATAFATMTFRFSPKLSTNPFSGRPLIWYYKPASAGKFRRVATTTTRRVGAGKIGGSLTYMMPSKTSRQPFTISWCFKLPAPHKDVGVGNPATSFRSCPK